MPLKKAVIPTVYLPLLVSPLLFSPLTLAEETRLDEVTVTGTREAQLVSETAASVGIIKPQEIDELKPGHPSEVMGKVAGVHVNVTGGEGHMAAIRQPITTSPVYLYLEDGIPTRSTGFFNHNALYEVNTPQAGGIEVTKGPGTALYGSDAIGGVINVLTKPAPLKTEFSANAEAGEHGWGRVLLSGGTSADDDGYRADLNLTHTDGWRDNTNYDRISSTLRWDHFTESGATIKTVISGSDIDQQTAGTSRLSKEDYENNPTLNYTPISYRKVQALRVSSAYEQEDESTLWSITPYARFNSMELLPNWSLSYDPQKYTTENYSLGLQSKIRFDLDAHRTRIITGLDIEHSPGKYEENEITPVKTGKIYTSYTEGATTYDYDVSFTGVSPYIHYESSANEQLRFSAGLRYDYMQYDYDNHLDALTTGSHRRPESETVDFDHPCPKLGVTYALSPATDIFASYRNTFRAPSASQLFRQGQAESTVDLKPVEADSFELGFRAKPTAQLAYEVSIYDMSKKDDILSFRDTTNGTRETQNAGKTNHRGIEFSLESALSHTIDFNLAYSYAEHTYDSWQPKTGVSYDGHEIKSAPRRMVDTRINWRPVELNGGRIELNWVSLGSYWLDDENTHKYAGHEVFNVRANYLIHPEFEVYGRINNMADVRYATGASYSQFRGEEYAPGLPRTVYVGLKYTWK